jgi:hypothetical protein
MRQGPVRNIMRLLLAVLLVSGSLAARRPPARADTDVTPWSGPFAIATGLSDAARPTLAYTPDGRVHALWESEGTIYYAVRASGAAWTDARRVAAGLSPSLALDSHGVLHAIFANQFLGNYDIFHITLRDNGWSLPTNVSRTYGVSVNPVLAAGPDGFLHAVWMDNAPGYWTIYLGSWQGGFWSSNAIPHARGQSPSIAVSRQGVIFVSWQDRLPSEGQPNGLFEIYGSQRIAGAWTLAINISDAPATDSIGAHVTVTPNGFGHMTWVDGGATVRYALGKEYYWPDPDTVVQVAGPARGPRIAAVSDTSLHIAWDEGDIVRVSHKSSLDWSKPEVIPTGTGTLKDVVLTPTTTGGVMVGWVQVYQPGNFSIFGSSQENDWRFRLWFPLLLER